jgi:hypothetical protein
MTRHAMRDEDAMRAFNLNLGYVNRKTLLLLIMLSFCAQFLSAQAVPKRKRPRRQHTIALTSSVRERVPDPPLFASLSRAALPQRPERSWESSSKAASFTAQPRSYRQTVNFNLLLPPTYGKLPSWTKNVATGKAVVASDLIPSVFASTSPTIDEGPVNPFIDPQYYARRIPGVGPIVDRVLKQSKAHPRLTRVLRSIQPQF